MPLRRRVALALLLAAVLVAACAQPHVYTTTTRGRASVRRRASREFMTVRSPLLQARVRWTHCAIQHKKAHGEDCLSGRLSGAGEPAEQKRSPYIGLACSVLRALRAQAWDSFCHRARECNKHPQVPWKAYLITLPGDEAKADFSLAQLRRLGLEVEVVHGINSTQASLLIACCCLPTPCLF